MGATELSFKVILSESYTPNLEQKAIAEALNLNLAPKTYRQYFEDTSTLFKSKEQILNKQEFRFTS